MREYHVNSCDNEYKCPYCGIEIVDWTGEELETREEYCTECGKEFMLVVMD